MKFQNVWSNFHLLILYFDIYLDPQCIERSMKAYTADQSLEKEHC